MTARHEFIAGLSCLFKPSSEVCQLVSEVAAAVNPNVNDLDPPNSMLWQRCQPARRCILTAQGRLIRGQPDHVIAAKRNYTRDVTVKLMFEPLLLDGQDPLLYAV
jgi:hypothetical protein